MALQLPSVQKAVYNRLPFFQQSIDNDQLIDDYTAEFLVLFAIALDIDTTTVEYLNLNNYPPCVKSLLPDLVGIQLVERKALLNIEGDGTTSTPGVTKYLNKAKAGDAEVEYGVAKADEITTGTGRLSTSDTKMIDRFMSNAKMKANGCGLGLVFEDYSLIAVQVVSATLPTIQVHSWDD